MLNIICWIILITLLSIGAVSIGMIWYYSIMFLIDWLNDNIKFKK